MVYRQHFGVALHTKRFFGPVDVSWHKYNNSGYPEIPEWYKKDHLTFHNYSVAIPEKDGFTMNHYSITIASLSFNDDGWYLCAARDQFSYGNSPFINLTISGG